MDDLLFLLSVLIAVVAGVFTPIFILVKAIETYRLVGRDRNVYVFKAVIALGVWLALSFGILFLIFVYVFSSAHQMPNAATDWTWLMVFLGITLGYGLAGLGLVRWMMRRE